MACRASCAGVSNVEVQVDQTQQAMRAGRSGPALPGGWGSAQRRLAQGLWLAAAAAGLLAGASGLARAAGPSPAVADALWLDRLTFGVTEQDLAELRRIGRPAWLAAQLRPAPDGALPEAVAREIAAMRLSRESGPQILEDVIDMRALARMPPASAADAGGMMGGESMQAPVRPPLDRVGRPAVTGQDTALRREVRRAANDLRDEAVQRSLLLAVHSPRQLQELLTWFWFNHFNVNPDGNPTMLAMVGDYEHNAIRRHVLGRFRDLLGAVATHPAMLVYLNNDRNGRGRINENYARELMELHTLGVDGGYTQQDVQQLAQVLTGLGVRRPIGTPMPPRIPTFYEGMSLFHPGLNIPGPKVLLGRTLEAQGWAQIEQALDMLARHPATARHVTRKLAQFFIADQPSPALLDRLAQRFRDTDGDLAAVMATLVNSPEFEASLDRKFKDPVRYVISAVRLTMPAAMPAGMPLRPQRLQLWLNQMGQSIYGRRTPDGYALDSTPWSGSGQMARRFDVAQEVAYAVHFGEARSEAERRSLSPDSAFSREVLLPSLSARTREVLEAAAGRPAEWRALLLSSPEFMTR